MNVKMHPAVGIARVGDSPTSFYLAPEQAGQLPIECDQDGNAVIKDGKEQPISKFKDAQQRVRRQAARSRVYGYKDGAPHGQEIEVGQEIEAVPRSGQFVTGEGVDIDWPDYLASTSSSWYECQE